MRFGSRFTLIMFVLTLVACDGALAVDTANPALVTLPAGPGPTLPPSPSPQAAVQQAATIDPAAAPVQPTLVPAPTALITSGNPVDTRLLWEWPETSRPSAIAPLDDRLAVMSGDGRFLWLDAASGQPLASAPLWSGIVQGESWGEVYTQGAVAVTVIREMSINSGTGLADSRARLAVYDASATEVWSLPQLGAQQFYSASLTQQSVLVGKWPFGFRDNTLAAYDLGTGNRQWEIRGADLGFRAITHDESRMYVLVDSAEGSSIVSYDWRTGDEVWRWSDPQVVRPDDLALDGEHLYVLSVDRVVALDPFTGTIKWMVGFDSAPEAGLAIRDDHLFLAPAPSSELGFRPGVVGLQTSDGSLRWHSLVGLLADPITVGTSVVWTVIKDYDGGRVYLSGLEAGSGLEQ
ncbi:MAG: PQQ-binding-like beta-propeller repeat protein, partial [Anaerolineae bacterium]|nr:PQQ-binding-like beta-propeller repeat protein [Anaerolineae bacterium]